MPQQNGKRSASTLASWRRLCAIRAALKAGRLPSPADRDWFVSALDLYEREAPVSRLSLDRAMGIAPRVGRSHWWVEQNLELRNQVLIEISETCFGDLPISQQAKQLAEECRKVFWNESSTLPAYAKDRLKEVKMKVSGFPDQAQIKNILEIKQGD